MSGYYACWLRNMSKNTNCSVLSYFCFTKTTLYLVNLFSIGMGYVFINLLKKKIIEKNVNVGIESIEPQIIQIKKR